MWGTFSKLVSWIAGNESQITKNANLFAPHSCFMIKLPSCAFPAELFNQLTQEGGFTFQRHILEIFLEAL